MQDKRIAIYLFELDEGHRSGGFSGTGETPQNVICILSANYFDKWVKVYCDGDMDKLWDYEYDPDAVY